MHPATNRRRTADGCRDGPASGCGRADRHCPVCRRPPSTAASRSSRIAIRQQQSAARAQVDVHLRRLAIIERRIGAAQHETLGAGLRQHQHRLRPVVRLVRVTVEAAAGDDEYVTLRIDGRSAGAPDAAAAAMRHRHRGEGAFHFGCSRIHRYEPAGFGFAEYDIKLRTVRTQIERAALHPEIEAPLGRNAFGAGIGVEPG